VTDGEDSAVHDVQPSASDSPVDRRSLHSRCDELPPGDHAMLALREVHDHGIHIDFASHIDAGTRFVGHGGSMARWV
jgi:hypothetical protein